MNDRAKVSILTVDDKPVQRETVRMLLSDTTYTIREASSGTAEREDVGKELGFIPQHRLPALRRLPTL